MNGGPKERSRREADNREKETKDRAYIWGPQTVPVSSILETVALVPTC